MARDDTAWRTKWQQAAREASRPFLAGDEPRVVIDAVASARPWTLVQVAMLMFGSIARYLAVTDTDVWLLRKSIRDRVTDVVDRVPRQAFGPREGRLRNARIGRESVWIADAEPEVAAADAVALPHGWAGTFERVDTRGALAHWIYAVLGTLIAWLGIGEASAQSVVPFEDSRWFGGVVLVLLGVLVLAAAIVLGWAPFEERGGPLLVPAGWAAIAVGAYLLWNSAIYGRAGTMWVLWIGWIVAAAVAMCRLPRPAGTTARGERGRGLVGALATAGVTLSFVWGVVQASALQALSSTAVGATLTLKATLARAPSADGDGMRGYLLTMDVDNTTAVRVPVVASMFRIIAVGTSDVVSEAPDAVSTSYRAVPETYADVVRYEPVTPPGWYLEPDETFHRQVVVLVPPDRPGLRHRVLRATVDLLVARASRYGVVRESVPRPVGDGALLQEFSLAPPGRVHRVARGTQKLEVTLSPRADLAALPNTGGEPDPASKGVIDACVADASIRGEDLCDAPLAGKWARFYGLVTTQTTAEVPLEACVPADDAGVEDVPAATIC